MFYTIYKTTCLLNGKFYIGKHQTKDLNDGYFGSGKLLVRAVKKHGIENFVTSIIAVYQTEHEMNLAEKILVVVDPDISYNLCNGGQGGFSFINKMQLGIPNFTKQNAKTLSIKGIQARMLRAENDPIWYADYKRKVSESQKGRPGYWLGKKHAPETVKKISEIKKLAYKGAGNPNFGKKRSAETKAKIAASVKAALDKRKHALFV